MSSEKLRPIVKCYRGFLEDLGLKIGSDYEVLKGDGEPLMISIRRSSGKIKLPLYLPVETHLDNDDGKKAYFHPACESSYRGQSEIFNAILTIINVKVANDLANVIDSLLAVAADTAIHRELNQSLMDIIADLGEVDGTTVKAWRQAHSKTTPFSGKQPLSVVFTARDKTVGERKCSRVAALRLPILEDDKLYLKRITKKSEQAIRQAFTAVLGDEDLIEGTNSPTAPYFIALARVYDSIMQMLYATAKVIDSRMLSPINYDGRWVRNLDKLHDWYRNDFYIQLEGNIGQGTDKEERKVEGAPTESQRREPPAVSKRTPQPEPKQYSAQAEPPPYQAPPQHAAPQHAPPQNPPSQTNSTRFRLPENYNNPHHMPPQYPTPHPHQQGHGFQLPPGYQTAQPAGFFDPRTGQWREKPNTPPPPPPGGHPYQGQYPPQGGAPAPGQMRNIISYDALGFPIYG